MSSVVRARIASASNAATFLSTYFREASLRGSAVALRRLCERLRTCRPSIWTDCSRQLLERDPHQGVALLDSALALHADDPALLRLKASAHRQNGDPRRAEQALRRAAVAAPDDASLMFELAAQLRDEAATDAAAAVVTNFFGQPRDQATILAASEFLASCGRHDLAYAICTRGFAADDTAAPLAFEAGNQALTLGRFEDARRHLRRAVQGSSPEWGALLPLSLSKRYQSPLDPDIACFSRTWENESIPDDLRLPAGFALGKAFDDLGLIAEAASVLRAANRLADLEQTWSSRNWQDFIEAQLTQHIDPLPMPVRTELVPVFIVGLPRTGTTLVADRLARHPQVRNRGELNWISFLSEQLAIERRFQDRSALARAAHTVLAHLRRDDAPARFYIDKNPLNFRHLRLIAALFPNARIIHCQRSGRDTALSIWSQLFDHPDNAYAYRFDHIRDLMRGHDRLMEALTPDLRQRVFPLHYEELVSDPAKTLNRLTSYLGLDTETDLLTTAARHDSQIGTASVWQARQSISTQSIGRADRYLEVLPELLDFPA